MNNLTLNGLGAPVPEDIYTTTTETPATGGKKVDWAKIFETGLDIFKTFKTSTQQPNVPGAPPPPPAGVSLKNVALIGGGIALATGTIIYFATRKKKK